MTIYFATSNQHKFQEAKSIFVDLVPSLKIEHFYFKHNEIRSDNIEEIATESLSVAFAQLKKQVFVEDTGLFINALNGFPGTFSAWVLGKIGNIGILNLIKNEKDRTATFRTCIAFTDGYSIQTFIGECYGRISTKARGRNGFGYDSIFIPEGYNETFAENPEIKNKLSHRYLSISKFASSESIKKQTM